DRVSPPVGILVRRASLENKCPFRASGKARLLDRILGATQILQTWQGVRDAGNKSFHRTVAKIVARFVSRLAFLSDSLASSHGQCDCSRDEQAPNRRRR